MHSIETVRILSRIPNGTVVERAGSVAIGLHPHCFKNEGDLHIPIRVDEGLFANDIAVELHFPQARLNPPNVKGSLFLITAYDFMDGGGIVMTPNGVLSDPLSYITDTLRAAWRDLGNSPLLEEYADLKPLVDTVDPFRTTYPTTR